MKKAQKSAVIYWREVFSSLNKLLFLEFILQLLIKFLRISSFSSARGVLAEGKAQQVAGIFNTFVAAASSPLPPATSTAKITFETLTCQ
jgi:hypothetical protein